MTELRREPEPGPPELPEGAAPVSAAPAAGDGADPASAAGLAVAEGPVLQVRPADREQALSLAARQGAEVRVRVRNTGGEVLQAAVSASEPWVTVPTRSLSLAPGQVREVLFQVPPLTLEPGEYSFRGRLRSNSLLGEEEVRVALSVGEPVGLLAQFHGAPPEPAAAWEQVVVEIEVRRTDGRPCSAAVSAEPWPHWLPRCDREMRRGATLLRLYAAAPGRSASRSVTLVLEDAEPGVERAAFPLVIARRPGPVLVWDDAAGERGAAEKEARDDPEWSGLALELPDLLPGDRRCGAMRVRNAGDRPAELFARVETEDPAQEWLSAGFGPARDPGLVPSTVLLPGRSVTVRARLAIPSPPERRPGKAGAGGAPAARFVWRGGRVVIDADGAPVTLKRAVNATVLAAVQPAGTRSRLTAAAIDLGLSLAVALLLYAAGWALLGDYGLAMLAQPVLAAVGGRSWSLAGGAALLLWWCLYALLLAGCGARYGTTPGKAYVGALIRRRNGARPGPARAALRGLLQALLLPLVAWVAALHPARVDFLDYLLDTRVVRVTSLWEE